MAVIKVKCRYCSQERVVKNGKATNGSQGFYCQDCRRSFQVEYPYKGHHPGIYEPIIELAFNGSGVRDTSRVLGISKNTVIRYLKKISPRLLQ